jgi:hypothetical protein
MITVLVVNSTLAAVVSFSILVLLTRPIAEGRSRVGAHRAVRRRVVLRANSTAAVSDIA